MGKCLTTDELVALATNAISQREAGRLAHHCETCAVCQSLLEEWRRNNVYADDIRRAIKSASSVASSEAAIACGLTGPVSMVPLMSSDGIGGYEILGEVHRGGQGVVYRAVQKSTKREVAIKVAFEILPQAGKRPHRFDREVELASRLNHPNIVSIFDSGTTVDGRCYFIMDYVHGLPVDQYVRERELDLLKTLELFISICDAVNHAHQRGVIHRDLKPSNILVDAEGIPRVLDFGLAKALGGAAAQFSSVVSAAGQLLGTVPYMAPEQLEGRPQAADIRTDVYALGVLMYEMLTGCLPYDVNMSPSEVLKAITEGSPALPSRAWNPVRGIDRRTSSRVRANLCPIDDELDAITLRAMTRHPERRYQNAADFARDVRHYLAGEPVEAKRDRGFYVLKKLLYRYRFIASVAAGSILLLAGTLAVITGLYVKVQEQRQVAQVERDHAVAAQQSADENAEQLRSVMYLGHIASAVSAAESGNTQRLREELYVCPADLRGWEWYSLISQFNLSNPSGDVLQGHTARVLAIRSVDRGRVMTGSQDGSIRIWDLDRMRQQGDPMFFGSCRDICLAPDGIHFAVYDHNGTVRVHSLGDNRIAQVANQPSSLCFSPDSQVIAVGQVNGYVDLFDAYSARQLWRLGPHKACASGLAFSPNGEFLASISSDEIRIWDPQSGQLLFSSAGQKEAISSLAWNATGSQLACGGRTGSLVLWNLLSQKIDRPFHVEQASLDETEKAPRDMVTALTYSPDGQLLVSSDLNRNLCLWDIRTGRLCGKITLDGSCTWLRGMTFDKTGNRLVGAGNDNALHVWDLDRVPYTISIKAHDSPTHAIAFADDHLIVSGADEGVVRLWELPSGRLLRSLTGHEGKVRALACSPDGSWIVSGSTDRTVRIWDAKSGSCRHILRGHEDGVLCVAVSPDGRWVASGGSDYYTKGKDNSIRIWDLNSGNELMCLRGHTAGVPSVAFSPDGSRIVSGSRDKTAIIWNLRDGRPILTLKGPAATVRKVVFDPSGDSILFAAEDNTVQRWDAATGHRIGPPMVHPKVLTDLAISPDGLRKVTCGSWPQVYVWPRRDINWELMKLPTSHQKAWSVAFSPDGDSLASSDEEGEICIWRAIGPRDLEKSPQAAEDLASGAMRLWSLRQRKDAESLFKESLGMHRRIFGDSDQRTVDLARNLARFQQGEFAEGPARKTGSRPAEKPDLIRDDSPELSTTRESTESPRSQPEPLR